MNTNKLPRRISLVLAAILLSALVAVFSSCSKDEKAKQKQAAAKRVVEKVDLSETIVTQLPDDSVGFFKIDGAHPAYKELAESPWSGSADVVSLAQSAKFQVKQFPAMLKRVGLDPANQETWMKFFAEAVFFVAPSPDGTGGLDFGAAFRPEGADLLKKINAIKSELQNSGSTVEDVEVSGASGFSYVRESQAAQGTESGKMFLVSKDGLGVLGSSEKLVEQVIQSKGENLPQVVDQEVFQRLTRGFPGEKTRFGVGYFDLKQMVVGPQAENPFPPNMPFRALAIAMAMDKTPQTLIHVLPAEDAAAESSWITALGSSSSESVLPAVPEKPLFLLSIDGSSIKSIVGPQLAEQKQKGGLPAAYAKQLELLDTISRVGLVASVAPVGQSMLPFPDLMILINTSEADETKAGIEQLISGSMGQMGALGMGGMGGMPGAPPGMQWTDKEIIPGIKARAMMHPMGVGVFIASKGDLVFITSTENMLRTALNDLEKETFAKSLSGKSEEVLIDTSTVGSLYLDFEQVGDLLGNLGGVLAMFAPPDPRGGGAHEFLKPEKIASLKKMGKMIAAVTKEDGLVKINSFYDLAAKK